MKRFFCWRLRTFQEWVLIWIVGIVVLIFLIMWGYWVPWTGFDGYVPQQDYAPEKKLWDWLDLLIVPAVLAMGAVYFNRAERQNESRIVEQRAQDALLERV